MTKSTAILIFAQSATTEAQQKRFKGAEALFTQLNAHTIAIAKATGLPYFVVSETEQHGHTFGERFSNAIQSVFTQGYTQVLSIGNDTPHLSTTHLLKAQRQLQTNDLVLGPSLDGGFYLMGIKKSYFNALQWTALPWQNRNLNHQILRYSNAEQLQVICLETLSDIDHLNDAVVVFQSIKRVASSIFNILKEIVITSIITPHYHIFAWISHSLATPINKGSPLGIS